MLSTFVEESCVMVGVDRLPAEFGTSDMLTFSGAPERICDLLFFLYCEQINFDITGVFENEDM